MEYTFLGIAGAVQTIPERFCPKGNIPYGIFFTTKLIMAVGFFYVMVPKALGDRNLKEAEVRKLASS